MNVDPPPRGPLVVAVAAQVQWDVAACPPGDHAEGPLPSSCRGGRPLEHTPVDAWRVTTLLTGADPSRYRILSEAPPTDARIPWPEDVLPATLASASHALRDLLATHSERQDVVLYLSTHGSGGLIHLQDRYHGIQDIERSFAAALRSGDTLVVIADSCDSSDDGELKQADLGSLASAAIRPRASSGLGLSRPLGDTEVVEFLIFGEGIEDRRLRGGVYTYELLGGWLGGADQTSRVADGHVDALELLNFVESYERQSEHVWEPIVRVPRPRSVWRLPAPPGLAALALPATGGPTRWSVSVLLGPEGRELELALLETFSLDGSPRTLRLAPGLTYKVVKIDLVPIEDEFHPRSDHVAWTQRVDGGVWSLVLEEGVAIPISEQIGDLVEAFGPLSLLPRAASRQHFAPRGLPYAGAFALSGLLDQGLAGGLAMDYWVARRRDPSIKYGLQLGLGRGVASDLERTVVRLAGGVEGDIHSRGVVAVTASAGIGPELTLVESPYHAAWARGLSVEAGPAVALWSLPGERRRAHPWVRVAAHWAPAFDLRRRSIEADDGRIVRNAWVYADLDRVLVSLTTGVVP